MRCSKCGTDNREGRKFCAECGASLAAKCPQCGAVNEPNEKFCGECGALLTAYATPAGAKAQPAAESAIRIGPEGSALEGERKTVTALFADIKGPTEIMRGLDPEE